MTDAKETEESEDKTERVLRGSGVVQERTKSGWREDVQMLAVKRKEDRTFGDLGGDGLVQKEHYATVAEINKTNAWFVLQALADYYNMELTEK